MVGGTPEIAGQLIASLLVAQRLGRWCTSLVAQVRSLAYLVKSQLFQGGKTLYDAAATYHESSGSARSFFSFLAEKQTYI